MDDHPLRRYRQKKKLSMEEFAAMMGVTVATISRWETGRRIPESRHWTRLKEITNGRIKVDDFTPQAAE